MAKSSCWLCHSEKNESEGRSFTLDEFNQKIAPKLQSERPQDEGEAVLRAALLGFAQATALFNPSGAKSVSMYWICRDCETKYCPPKRKWWQFGK
jgi:hypothetical protein